MNFPMSSLEICVCPSDPHSGRICSVHPPRSDLYHQPTTISIQPLPSFHTPTEIPRQSLYSQNAFTPLSDELFSSIAPQEAFNPYRNGFPTDWETSTSHDHLRDSNFHTRQASTSATTGMIYLGLFDIYVSLTHIIAQSQAYSAPPGGVVTTRGQQTLPMQQTATVNIIQVHPGPPAAVTSQPPSKPGPPKSKRKSGSENTPGTEIDAAAPPPKRTKKKATNTTTPDTTAVPTSATIPTPAVHGTGPISMPSTSPSCSQPSSQSDCATQARSHGTLLSPSSTLEAIGPSSSSNEGGSDLWFFIRGLKAGPGGRRPLANDPQPIEDSQPKNWSTIPPPEEFPFLGCKMCKCVLL